MGPTRRLPVVLWVLIVALLAVAASASAIALLPGEGSSNEPVPVASSTTIAVFPATSTTADTDTTTTGVAPAVESVTFLAAGDIGGHEHPAGDVLTAMALPESDFLLILGDLSYEEIEPATAWCEWVQEFFPTGYPIEIVVGNHEDDQRAKGFIRDFTPCLPDRMNTTGDYGVEYYFDAGPVRVIMIGANLSVDGVSYDYSTPGPRRDWLLARVDEAEAAGLWTVVGMHKVCVTTGSKECEIGESTIDGLIAHGADLILHGHEHNYQRSHQLRCVDVDTTTPACLADTDSSHRAGEGAVIVVAGWVGHTGYEVSTADSEAGYFAVIGGPNLPGWAPGYLMVEATETTLSVRWTSIGGGTDAFTITR